MTAAPVKSESEIVFTHDKEYVMGTYLRYPVLFVRGEGVFLYDSLGQEWLDFLAGIAVVQVGHCHPRIAQAIAQQASTLMHISNLFHNPLQARLAERLCKLTDMEKVFFCNSGAEANECAIKIARKWGKQQRGNSCYEIITFHGSFHGRTLGAVTATAQPKYQESFAPLMPGFRYLPLNDIEALKSAVTEQTCAVMLEPIQGESGVNLATAEYLAAVRELCTQRNVLLILDEVQCGTGRTGKFLGSQSVGVDGDVITLAKGIADGFPMGACMARGTAATTLVPGDHGSTFAGQPLACAAALATLDVIEEEKLMQNAAHVGSYFKSCLQKLQAELPGRIQEVRGRGLMIGVQLAKPEAKAVYSSMMEQRIIANAVGDSILRFVPPLVVNESHCDRVITALKNALVSLA